MNKFWAIIIILAMGIGFTYGISQNRMPKGIKEPFQKKSKIPPSNYKIGKPYETFDQETKRRLVESTIARENKSFFQSLPNSTSVDMVPMERFRTLWKDLENDNLIPPRPIRR